MENKEFTLYPEALELKELGYDEISFGRFNNEGDLLIAHTEKYVMSTGLDRRDFFTQAPTYSQAFRFFREKFGLYPDIHRIGSGGKFGACIEDLITGNSLEMATEDPSDYEEAELDSLRKMIEILKRTRRSQA